MLSATDGQFITVTADAGSPVLTVRINGRNYLGDALERDIEIVPGSTVTINSNGDSDTFATVHRMRTLGSMIGERINIVELELLGIKGNLFRWLKRYLENRTQIVKNRKFCSNSRNVSCGVPQGSVLGPNLFIL